MTFYDEILEPMLRSLNEYGERNAFCIKETFYTYKQLGWTVGKIRNAVRVRAGGFRKQVAGLVINDDIETYASIIALWMDGTAYVPLHPDWPLERVKHIIDQVELDMILDSSVSTRLDNEIVINTGNLHIEGIIDLFPIEGIEEDDLAYILFTSGSTGEPKGVPITRGNLAAFMNSFWKTGISITCEDRCLQCFDLTFDISVQGYLVPLTKGACCYTVPYDEVKYVYVGSLIEDHRLTFGAMAPSMLKYLRPYFDEIDASSMRYCVLGAEGWPLELIQEWSKYAVNSEFYDFYGPTETTIYCTFYKMPMHNDKSHNDIISIGRPMANVTVLIVDENLKPVPVGEKGELCIAGPQVTPGYWKNEAQNRKSFFEIEVDGCKMRFYRTGDLCQMDSDGDIMYSGRIDLQAKIQGFRVELGEIEHHAREFLGNIGVACVAFDNEHGITEIAMFIESNEFDTSQLIGHLKSRLPSYMIPTRVLFESIFPLNQNSKTDRKKLKTLIK